MFKKISETCLLMADSLQLKNPIHIFIDKRSIFIKGHIVRARFKGYSRV